MNLRVGAEDTARQWYEKIQKFAYGHIKHPKPLHQYNTKSLKTIFESNFMGLHTFRNAYARNPRALLGRVVEYISSFEDASTPHVTRRSTSGYLDQGIKLIF